MAIQTPPDFTKMTDADLRAYIKQNTAGAFDKSSLEMTLGEVLKASGFTDLGAANIAKDLTQKTIDTGSVPSLTAKYLNDRYAGKSGNPYKDEIKQELRSKFNTPSGVFDFATNYFNQNSDPINKTFNLGDYKVTNDLNLQNAQDLLNQRTQTATDQQAVNDYLANAPQQLAQSRSNFYDQQRAAAQDYLKSSVIPKNLEPIERSGLASDREVASMIASLYGGVQSSLDESESNQAIQDVNFFSDAAYKSKLQDLINAHGNVQAQIASDYSTASQNQLQGFQSAQSKLMNQFDVNLFKQQNEQALNEYNAKLKQQQDMINKKGQSNLWSSIGSTAGMIGGAAAFGPTGALFGGQFGNVAGSMSKGAA